MSGPRNIMAYAGAILVAALVIGGVTFAGYQAGWWLKADATQRQTEIFDDSYAKNKADRDAVLDKVATVTDIDVQITTATPEQKAPLVAQRKALVNQICITAEGIENLPNSTKEFVRGEC